MSEKTLVNELDKLVEDSNIYNKAQAKTQKELNEENEVLRNCIESELEDVTVEATEISVDDAAEYYASVLLKGNTEQASYDGKNILKSEYFYPNNATGFNSIKKLVEEGNNYLTFEAIPNNQSSYNIIFPCKPNTNYVYKCEKIILYNENDEIMSESGGWYSGNSKAFSSYTLQDTTSATMGYTKYVSSKSGALSGTNVSGKYVKFTTTEDETECCIFFQGDKANKIKIINPMLYEGTDTDIDYEPYVRRTI